MVQSITPNELEVKRRGAGTVELIDVRTPAEFEDLHVQGARNVPLDSLEPHAIGAERKAGAPLCVICATGARAARAAEALTAIGLDNVLVVEGGTKACAQAGLPVVRGRPAMSLERQVRIAAGGLIVFSVVMAWLVNSYWIGLAAFVGVGLMFSGITDTCGMAMVLAKSPWNGRPRSQSMPACPK